MAPTKTYLGDGLYASYDGYQIELSSHDGVATTNAVYLNPEVFVAFTRFVDAVRDDYGRRIQETEQHNASAGTEAQ